MSLGGEFKLIEWLTRQALPQSAQQSVRLGIGDDMAVLDFEDRPVLITSDMLLDGVHFDTSRHDRHTIGRKALACGLSDCAAMAVQPIAAVTSVALPRSWSEEQAQDIYRGMRVLADEFDCAIVGGDTTAWEGSFAIDVTVLGSPCKGRSPVQRSGAKPDDLLYVTGRLGGSLMNRNMTFTPRVREAQEMGESLGDALHAMMDISDGLALDLHRMCEASSAGATLNENLLNHAIHEDAVRASEIDGRSPMEHALSDGEDFELLCAIDGSTALPSMHGINLIPIGQVTPTGLLMKDLEGRTTPIEPKGFDHLA